MAEPPLRPMRQVGTRRERTLVEPASGELLIEFGRFNDALSRLAPSTFMPKGVYRYKSHEEANAHAQECLVRGMAELAARRR